MPVIGVATSGWGLDQFRDYAAGIHYCFGAPLARLEAQIALGEIALGELARRLENPRLVTTRRHHIGPILCCALHLLVEFDNLAPAQPGAASRPREPEEQPSRRAPDAIAAVRVGNGSREVDQPTHTHDRGGSNDRSNESKPGGF